MLKNAGYRERDIDRYVDLHCEEVDGVAEAIDMYNQIKYNK